MKPKVLSKHFIGAVTSLGIASLLLSSCASKTSTSPHEAASQPGSTRTVCSRVAEAIEDPVSDGPLHLYLDRPSPDQSLIVTIQHRRTAGNLRYLARVVCVTGQIEQSPEGPRIVVAKASQVSVSSDPVPRFEVTEVEAHKNQAVRICGPIASLEWKPGSDLEATLVLGSGNVASSLWVQILDRRGLEIEPGTTAKRACVTGYVRISEDGRPLVVVRDVREVAAEQ